jgi:hypothetical protein
MDSTLKKLLSDSQSENASIFVNGLSDLRYVIERFTMNRYDKKEEDDYLVAFYDKDLISYKIEKNDLPFIKHFLIFLLFNCPNRAVLTSKCIKVLFDSSIIEAICNGIIIYLYDDHTTCELIYCVQNAQKYIEYLKNETVIKTWKQIEQHGGEFSREAIKFDLKSILKNYE